MDAPEPTDNDFVIAAHSALESKTFVENLIEKYEICGSTSSVPYSTGVAALYEYPDHEAIESYAMQEIRNLYEDGYLRFTGNGGFTSW